MKKTNILLFFAIFIIFVISVVIVPTASAVPAFARQTGQACSNCHFQHFPALNAFGRTFKADGYTMIGDQGKVEGEDLSIPDTLNASLVVKTRYQKTNGNSNGDTNDDDDDKNKGELQFPDEAALLIGGRAGEHVGFLLEAGLTPGETQVTDSVGDTVTVPETNLFTSFKMPIVYDVGPIKLNLIPFTTDALGASYGFELLNTGAVRHQRVLEHRTEISAQQYIGTSGAAQGVAFVVSNDMFFVNYTRWVPTHGTTDAGPYLQYVRAAATPNIGNLDIGAGVQWWGGTTKTGGIVQTKSVARAWAVDAQLQGEVGVPLGVYLTYGHTEATIPSPGKPINIFNGGTNNENVWSVLTEVGVLPGKVTVAAGYRSGNLAADKTNTASLLENNRQKAITLGSTYMLAQNVELQLNHSWYQGDYYHIPENNGAVATGLTTNNGDQFTTLMIFAAF